MGWVEPSAISWKTKEHKDQLTCYKFWNENLKVLQD